MPCHPAVVNGHQGSKNSWGSVEHCHLRMIGASGPRHSTANASVPPVETFGWDHATFEYQRGGRPTLQKPGGGGGGGFACLLPCHCLPKSSSVWVRWNPLKAQCGCAVEQRPCTATGRTSSEHVIDMVRKQQLLTRARLWRAVSPWRMTTL